LLISTVRPQAYSDLPEDPVFTDWVPWAKRNSIPGTDAPGVYVLAHFDSSPPKPSDPLSQDLVYIGETSGQTLRVRWRQFHTSATTGKHAHSGGRTYFASFGPSKLPLLYVSPFPVRDSGLPAVGAYIKYIERMLLWNFLLRRETLPTCNKE